MSLPSNTDLAPASYKERAKTFYQRYHHWQDPSFFIVGFLLDMVMTGRIDETFGILQQGIYLILIATFATMDWYDQIQPFAWQNRLQQAWAYRTPVIHFLLGTLLNCYTIFYFKSASLLTSFVFLLALVIIVVANELPSFKKFGAFTKFAMLSLCTISFLVYLVPIVYGRIGIIPFLLALILSLFFQYSIYKYLLRRLGNHVAIPSNRLPLKFQYMAHPAFKTVMLPALAINILFTLMYVFKVLPPVPLSAQYLGVYHSLSKENGTFKLGYTRPNWYFWQNGDQTFIARPGDKIYIFTRLFSPANFKDQVNVKFETVNAKGKWEFRDSIPMNIEGGREEGFRGYVFKSNFTPGKWRVRLTTTDDREIRRIYYSVEMSDATSPVEFNFDHH